MFTRIRLIFLTMAMLSLPALADRLPEHFPRAFMHSGVINGIDPRSGLINIGDIELYLTPNTVIRDKTGQRLAQGSLKSGSRVGCNYSHDAKGRTVIDEMWLLPKNALPLGLPGR